MAKNELIKKIKYDLDLHGISGVIRKAWKRIGNYIYYTTNSIWYERKLDNYLPAFIPRIDLETYFLVQDKSEIIEWLEINRSRFPWIVSKNETDFAQSYQHPFFILKYKKNIIGYIKIGIGPTYINDYNKAVIFNPETAFIYDTFILPEYRGMNLTVFSLLEVARYLKEQNYTRILCCIEEWNNSSKKAFEKAGFISRDSIRFIRIVSFSFYLRDGYRLLRSLEKVFHSLT